jgi:membrane protease YdiL (CAAX protease family)
MPTAVRYFAWNPSRHTVLALAAGLASVALSASLIPLSGSAVPTAVLRDFAQVFLLGILLPLGFLLRTKMQPREFGFHTQRWLVFLAINLALAIGLLVQFRRSDPLPPGFNWEPSHLWLASYVMLTLVFELVFFYGFLRTLFERAFGAVAGVILAAAFYAFHHMGFQPEYAKLFLVGILYATVFRLGNSALLIFPFFLGVGGVYDVLFKSKVVSPVEHVELRTVALAALMIGAALWARHRGALSRPTGDRNYPQSEG